MRVFIPRVPMASQSILFLNFLLLLYLSREFHVHFQSLGKTSVFALSLPSWSLAKITRYPIGSFTSFPGISLVISSPQNLNVIYFTQINTTRMVASSQFSHSSVRVRVQSQSVSHPVTSNQSWPLTQFHSVTVSLERRYSVVICHITSERERENNQLSRYNSVSNPVCTTYY